ncbi:response regulator transcription factor [Sulfurimonas sp.]|uniref:response regulator transcription factor n=1 Tax=Sulfurimonas sp. TaxID=2022749 RepID=UPI00262810EF|nr:response regulator transcription factor [Sulfurimonas sp.]
MKKVLVVEDDIDLNTTVTKYLTMKGYACLSVYEGKRAVEKVYEETFDIVILDVKLPNQDGFCVAQEIRKNSNIPIIFLTSLNSQKDVERGFLSGGDDYITKPFSLAELFMRVEAVLRRVYQNNSILIMDDQHTFDTQSLTLYKNGIPVHLTEKETLLLSFFLQNKNNILSRREIFDKLYDFSAEPSDASLRVFINSLRKKIGKEKIETIKNLGYRYVG